MPYRGSLKIPVPLLALSIAMLAACTSTVASDALTVQTDENLGLIAEDSQSARPMLSIDISMYLLVDESDPAISSLRTEDEVREILSGMNDIWSQADIHLELRRVSTVDVPRDVLERTVRGNLRIFFQALGDGVQIPEPSTINAFYVRSVGGPNGITPFSSRTFFVIDEPSVHDRRVSSHEVGHILGLHHDLEDSGTLMFSGTNGMKISAEEATVARYVAKGILNGTR